MPEQPKPGSIVHFELHVKDRKKVEKFYEGLFGWKFQEVPGIDYSLFQAPSGPGGGIGGLQPGNWQPGVINYIGVNSVDDYVEKVKRAGGKIVVPKNAVMDQGWFAVFEDPSGTRMALWQQNPDAPQMQGPPQQQQSRPQQQPRQQQPQKQQQQSW